LPDISKYQFAAAKESNIPGHRIDDQRIGFPRGHAPPEKRFLAKYSTPDFENLQVKTERNKWIVITPSQTVRLSSGRSPPPSRGRFGVGGKINECICISKNSPWFHETSCSPKSAQKGNKGAGEIHESVVRRRGGGATKKVFSGGRLCYGTGG
jgi:hypothetical protein